MHQRVRNRLLRKLSLQINPLLRILRTLTTLLPPIQAFGNPLPLPSYPLFLLLLFLFFMLRLLQRILNLPNQAPQSLILLLLHLPLPFHTVKTLLVLLLALLLQLILKFLLSTLLVIRWKVLLVLNACVLLFHLLLLKFRVRLNKLTHITVQLQLITILFRSPLILTSHIKRTERVLKRYLGFSFRMVPEKWPLLQILLRNYRIISLPYLLTIILPLLLFVIFLLILF